jgi:hypothetical protein
MIVLVGLGGAGAFLCLRQRQAGHLLPTDWLTAGMIFAVSALLVRAARPRPAGGDDEDSETRPESIAQRKGLLWIGLVCLFLWILYGGAGGLGEGWTKSKGWMRTVRGAHMIRTLAGQPDETGWVPARSEAGGFSVHVPDSFNEAVTVLKMSGRLTPVVIVGVKTGDLKYVALAAPWTGSGKDLKTRVKAAAKSLCQFEDSVVLREDLFEGRFPLIEIEGDVRAGRGLAKIIATDRAVYGLEVEGPELTDSARADAKRFFDSFAIVAPEPNEAVIRAAIEAGDPNQ